MAKLEIPSAKLVIDLTRGNLKVAMASAEATNPHALWMVPYDQIRIIPGFNTRIRTPAYEARVEWLTNSIMENGFYQNCPLTGFVAREDGKDVIYLTGGHRRHEAAGRAIKLGAPIEALPMVMKPKGTSMIDLSIELDTENESDPLTPMEKAINIKRLIGYGLDEATIAKRLGYTSKYVSDLLTLVAAPKVVQDMIALGQVSSTLALHTLNEHGSQAANVLKEAIKEAEATGKTKATGKHVKKATAASKPPKPKWPKEINATDVLADAAACGFPSNRDNVIEGIDERLIKLAATLYARVGVEVFMEEPAPQETPADGPDDPADDL